MQNEYQRALKLYALAVLLPFIGILIGAYFVYATASRNSTLAAVLMILCFFIAAYIVWRLMVLPLKKRNYLLKNGIAGSAEIIAIKDTGITVNKNPQVKLTLQVADSLGRHYTTDIRMLISRINPAYYSVGEIVTVLIDPNDENNIVITD